MAKNSIELWRIQLFGRWSSEAFLLYIRDAPVSQLDSTWLQKAEQSCPYRLPRVNFRTYYDEYRESEAATTRSCCTPFTKDPTDFEAASDTETTAETLRPHGEESQRRRRKDSSGSQGSGVHALHWRQRIMILRRRLQTNSNVSNVFPNFDISHEVPPPAHLARTPVPSQAHHKMHVGQISFLCCVDEQIKVGVDSSLVLRHKICLGNRN